MGGDMLRNLLAALAVSASLFGPASAGTIRWAVSLTFEDGGTGSGTFTIDPSTLVVSSVDITTTPGTSPVWTSTIHYSSPLPVDFYSPIFISFSPAVYTHVELHLSSGSLLTAAPSIDVYALESASNVMGGEAPRIQRDGRGTISATPLPGALPLFATGLGALGLLAWRRKRKT